MNKNLLIIQYYYLFNNNLNKYSINIKEEANIYCKIGNVVCKITLDFFTPFVITLGMVIIIICAIISYLDPVSNHFLLLAIFLNLLVIVSCQQFMAMICMGLVSLFIILLILGFKFKQIANNIKICVKQNEKDFIRYDLMDLIEEHNYFSKMTADMNKFIRIIILAFYYIALPVLSVTFYMGHHKNTEMLTKILGFYFTLFELGAILLVTGFCTWIINAAHSPYNMLEMYLSKHTTRITISTRLKIMTYIERLFGPDIGFYCYDLFPMNSYEFYQMIAISVCNYFLLMSLL